MTVHFAAFGQAEIEQVNRIMGRAKAIAAMAELELDPLTMFMDLAAVHYHSPLDLEQLAGFPDADFAHDVFGIARHIDRETGKLRDCFVPRCAVNCDHDFPAPSVSGDLGHCRRCGMDGNA